MKRITILSLIVILLVATGCSTFRTQEVMHESDKDFSAKIALDIPDNPGVGPTDVTILIHDYEGNPIDGAVVKVLATVNVPGVKQERSNTKDISLGRYLTDEFEFTVAGEWTITAEVTLPDGSSTKRTFDSVTIVEKSSEQPLQDKTAPREIDVVARAQKDALDVANEEYPSLDLSFVANPDGTWTFYIATDMKFTKASETHTPMEGHVNVYVNDELKSIEYENTFTISSLEPGNNDIKVTLVSNIGQELQKNGQIISALVKVPFEGGDPTNDNNNEEIEE